jgi:hypothetical protein
MVPILIHEPAVRCCQDFAPATNLIPKILPRDPKAGSGPTNPEGESFLASSLVVSLPLTPTCPGI